MLIGFGDHDRVIRKSWFELLTCSDDYRVSLCVKLADTGISFLQEISENLWGKI